VKPIEAEDSKEEEEVVLLEDETEPFDDGNPWFYDIEGMYIGKLLELSNNCFDHLVVLLQSWISSPIFG